MYVQYLCLLLLLDMYGIFVCCYFWVCTVFVFVVTSRYVEYLGIEEPSDDIRLVLLKTALNLGKTVKVLSSEGSWVQMPNLQAASSHFIKGFRQGKFGRVLLDNEFL
ncbi:mitochondrial GTPase 1-like [Tachypleus tridentatus]|uniref:mitochondrial GTPase 1-like n=1 Tax=Tachypleus tridentatus TaxID=6853 RepID=UPI003FD4CF6B